MVKYAQTKSVETYLLHQRILKRCLILMVEDDKGGETSTFKAIVNKVRKGPQLENEYVMGGTFECTNQ